MSDEQKNTAVSAIVASGDLDVTILGWLHEKANLSNSPKTEKAYKETLLQFRILLHREGLDLDSQDDASQVRIAFLAQGYASHSVRPGRQVKASTHNQRLAILSSFYEYAKGKRLVKHNPIVGVKRGKVQAYAGARALAPETVQGGLWRIDRESHEGKRDYALLATLLQTGQHVQEVATLQLQHVTLKGAKVVLSFEHCKGDKQTRDALPIPVSAALLIWLTCWYGPTLQIGTSGDERPVWVSLAQGGRAGKSYGQALGIQAIEDVSKKYLGRHVYATRHTFAQTM